MTVWRFLAQRVLTGEWIHTDLPIERTSGPSWELNGVGSFSGRIEPEHLGVPGRRRLADDGREILEEWGTLIYAEADGVIRWGGIVISCSFEGQAWEFEAASFATYPHGIPYDGSEYLREKIDPADILRFLWDFVQHKKNDGDLGVTVAGTTSARVGTSSTRLVREAEAVVKQHDATVKAREKTLDAARKLKAQRLKEKQAAYKVKQAGYKVKQGVLRSKQAAYKVQQARYKDLQAAKKAGSGVAAAQTAYDNAKDAYKDRTTDYKNATAHYKNSVIPAYNAVVNVYKAASAAVEAPKNALKSAKDARTAAKDKVSDLKEKESEDGGGYLLQWWDMTDIGGEIAELAESTPFDWVESHKWKSGKTDVSHTIRVHYPRAGTRRTDLAFVEGENIISFGTPERDGDGFANVVLGIGAGEGAKSIRSGIALRDGRLRRPFVLDAKQVTRKARLDAMSRNELNRARRMLVIPSITVRNHPHARIGSWQLGDDILVKVRVAWQGDVAIWHRIVGWELDTDDTATLTLERSDSFIYGG